MLKSIASIIQCRVFVNTKMEFIIQDGTLNTIGELGMTKREDDKLKTCFCYAHNSTITQGIEETTMPHLNMTLITAITNYLGVVINYPAYYTGPSTGASLRFPNLSSHFFATISG